MTPAKSINDFLTDTAIALLALCISAGALLLARAAEAQSQLPIVIGLDAAMSGEIGQSGEAIRRGAQIAIQEINQSGGVLGRKLKLSIKDHRGIPARGVDNIHAFAEHQNLVAILGGLHTPVALAELKAIHEHKLIYLGPWAAGTPIVDNGFEPNFVFRVSARDQFAGGYLIDKALERGFRKPGLLLWRTGWGRSNRKAMVAAMSKKSMQPAGIQWFNTSQKSVTREINALLDAGADVIMLVANAPEGLTVIRDMAARPANKRVPIISHWGITGANIVKKDPKAFHNVELTFLQTYSFYQPPFPRKAEKFKKAYCANFGVCGSNAKIVSPVGSAHAYDLVHILKLAIQKAGTTDRGKVRSALERLGRYEGLVRTYDPPFTTSRHDALDRSDFRLCRYDKRGAIVPMAEPATQ
ncbi:MAG: ABC transporter substrate-binding protein [Hyphomicrobiaceae bacterium]|nr:ABC transporter substrate-binding protein [Hyphomicrobiaceae bacterium]